MVNDLNESKLIFYVNLLRPISIIVNAFSNQMITGSDVFVKLPVESYEYI